ncbi:MAG: Mu transposase C-terminal domain-containing protein [Anaerolineae bacterium]|nr:Mu transposase C-terminal domain-containing protein [Anaerolineae bacterium]
MSPVTLEGVLRPGWYLYWQSRRYQIQSFDTTALTIQVEDLETEAAHTLALIDLLLGATAAHAPVFAPTPRLLEARIRRPHSGSEVSPTADLPDHLLAQAKRIIRIVQQVDAQLRCAGEKDAAVKQTDTLRQIVAQLDDPVSLATYYRYRACYQQASGDLGRIAASLRRSSYNQSRLSGAQQHFVDLFILRFYARQPPIRPAMLYRLMVAARQRTGGLWPDPARCTPDVPQDLVAELLNPDIPLTRITENPEKRCLLTPIDLPSRSWLYGYLRWFEQQPEQGRQVMTARHGKALWEQEQRVFDTFVTQAAFPLQYVFADHWLLDVFVVDPVTRSHPVRLWLTVLLDAYSRCVLGMALLYETPCIESIQQALQHAIWPKTTAGVPVDWPYYGIPQQLSLDNAWAHHSHSLENLARVLSQGGEYPSMDLVFRPPYKGRYGALVERFFGNLSGKVKELLPGAIAASTPPAVRQAAKAARLLYTDLDRILHDLIRAYHHTPHRELGGQTPHDRWQQGMAWSVAHVPPQTPAFQRLFWRLSPRTRVLTSKGIHAFGMTYWSPALQGIPRLDRQGVPIHYRFRYDPHDISRIALFHDDRWVGDITARPLQQADGSLLPLSLWERDLSRQLAGAAGAADSHWLHFVHELDTLSQQRRREQRQTAPATRQPAPRPTAYQTEAALERADTAALYADYTDLLTQFMEEPEA